MSTSLQQIIDDVASFKERTGRFPKRDETDPPRPGATWTAYEQILRKVHGMTLRGLLDTEFGALNTKKRRLTLGLVKRRGREHFTEHGAWPTRETGQVEGEPEGETWLRWEGAVQQGLRGLREPRPSLAHVFTNGEPDSANRAITRSKGRSVGVVIEFMREFNERTGTWPTETTDDADLKSHGETWRKLDRWLRAHHETTLVKLAAECLDARNANRPGALDLIKLVRETKRFIRKNGRRPTKDDGPISGWEGEAWGNVHKTLSIGGRGTCDILPKTMTLMSFVERYCENNEKLPGRQP